MGDKNPMFWSWLYWQCNACWGQEVGYQYYANLFQNEA